MDKKIILIITVLLCGCSNENREVTCILRNGNNHKNIKIESRYDDILSISLKEYFYIPYEYLANPEIDEDIQKQIKGIYDLEENYLVRETCFELNDAYSLSKTIESLGDKGYVCK